MTKDGTFEPNSVAYDEYFLGYDYFNLGQLKDAQAHWAKVAEVDPGDMKFATLIAAEYTSRATSDHTDKKNEEALQMTDLRIATLVAIWRFAQRATSRRAKMTLPALMPNAPGTTFSLATTLRLSPTRIKAYRTTRPRLWLSRTKWTDSMLGRVEEARRSATWITPDDT